MNKVKYQWIKRKRRIKKYFNEPPSNKWQHINIYFSILFASASFIIGLAAYKLSVKVSVTEQRIEKMDSLLQLNSQILINSYAEIEAMKTQSRIIIENDSPNLTCDIELNLADPIKRVILKIKNYGGRSATEFTCNAFIVKMKELKINECSDFGDIENNNKHITLSAGDEKRFIANTKGLLLVQQFFADHFVVIETSYLDKLDRKRIINYDCLKFKILHVSFPNYTSIPANETERKILLKNLNNFKDNKFPPLQRDPYKKI